MGPNIQVHHGLQDKVRISQFFCRFLSVCSHCGLLLTSSSSLCRSRMQGFRSCHNSVNKLRHQNSNKSAVEQDGENLHTFPHRSITSSSSFLLALKIHFFKSKYHCIRKILDEVSLCPPFFISFEVSVCLN